MTKCLIPYRVYSRREFVVLLKSLGFVSERHSKHEIFSDGRRSIALPHGITLNKMLTRRLIKQLNGCN